MNEREPEISIPEGFALLHSNPDEILSKRRDFLGTAAIVDELLPYYNHALKAISPTAGNTTPVAKFVAATQGTDYSHLPASLAKEVREHLGQLQASAFSLEAAGDLKRANTIRDVGMNLDTMLKTIQQMGAHEAVATSTHRHRAGN